MLKCHELIGFVSPDLTREVIEFAFNSDKPLYKAVLAAVAEANRVRPAFLEKKPRTQRHVEMIATLSRPRLEEAAANLLSGWLLKSETAMVVDFLDTLGIPHEEGVVEEFPKTVQDEKLKAGIEKLLASHPHEKVAVYLNAVEATSGVEWPNLGQLLEKEPRLQIG